LRGVVADEQLLPILLELHQDLIERVLRKYPQIRFVPWTLRILQTHYNVDNEHIFDPIRELARDLRQVRKAIGAVESRYLVPDPDNPAQRIIDHRALSTFDKLSRRKEQLLTKLQDLHRSKEENLTDSIFALVSEISRSTKDGGASNGMLQITTDPRSAAGTTAVGGDTMRSSGRQTETATGTAYNFYAISGF
jgi:hypothetical protein